MWRTFQDFVRFLSGKNRRTTSRPPRVSTFRPRLEALEDRCLLSAGALDPTFGNGAGYVTTALSPSSRFNQAYSALVQPDGKIIAAGFEWVGPLADDGSQAGLVRYNPDGSLDTSFGTDGEALGPVTNPKELNYTPMAALYPTTGTANDGKIVLAQFSTSFSLARYNPNGTLDTSFGNNGIATANFGSTLGTLGSFWADIQPDGKVVVVGISSDSKTLELARFNVDGSLDATFGQGGLVKTPLPGGDVQEANETLLLQPNGGLIVTTMAYPKPGDYTGAHWDLIGYNADGSLNTSFGTGGFVSTTPVGTAGDDSSGSAALYPTQGTANDGKIVMVGWGHDQTSGVTGMLVKRYNPNGTLDSTFGTGGSVFTPLGKLSWAYGVAIQPDGKIVVSGESEGATSPAQAVVRYNTDGSLDSTFGSGGSVITAIGSESRNSGPSDVVLQPNGDIVVPGAAYIGGKYNFTVTRYLGDTTMAVTGFPAQSTAGVPGSFTVTALNSSGGTNTGYTGTVHFTSSDLQAVLPADYTFTAADQGVHTFNATLKTASIQSITAADATDGFFGADTGITVNPAAASTLSLTGFSSPANAGTPGNFTVTAIDPYGNRGAAYTGTVHFTSSDPAAVLPPDYTFTTADNGVHTFSATLNTTGTQSLTVTDTATGSLTGAQTGITVNPASLPATSLSITGYPSTATAGTTGTITVTAKDANGNVATGYRGTVHFTSSDGQAVLPLDYTFTGADQGVHTFSVILKTAGTQSLTATDTATGSITGSEKGIVVSPAALSMFRISAPSSVPHGVAFSSTVTALDAYGNVVTGYTGTVFFFSTDGKAILPANYKFKASDAGVHTFVNKTTLRTRGAQTLFVADTPTNDEGSVNINVT